MFDETAHQHSFLNCVIMLINFKSTNRSIDTARIEKFQETSGIKLPACYRDFLLKNNGGRPVQNIFPIIGFEDPIGSVQVFFGLDTSVKSSDLDWRIRNRIVSFPVGLLEIACTDGNDLVCIDTKLTGAPVYFFDHRPSWGNGLWRSEDLYRVAADFPEFLSKLKSTA